MDPLFKQYKNYTGLHLQSMRKHLETTAQNLFIHFFPSGGSIDRLFLNPKEMRSYQPL